MDALDESEHWKGQHEQAHLASAECSEVAVTSTASEQSPSAHLQPGGKGLMHSSSSESCPAQGTLRSTILSVLHSCHLPAVLLRPGWAWAVSEDRHKFRRGSPLQTSVWWPPSPLCPCLMFAPVGSLGALSWCSSCVLFSVLSLQGKGCESAPPSPRSCPKGALYQVHPPHGQQAPSNPSLTPTLSAGVCIILQHF